jgi:hypothetical protein
MREGYPIDGQHIRQPCPTLPSDASSKRTSTKGYYQDSGEPSGTSHGDKTSPPKSSESWKMPKDSAVACRGGLTCSIAVGSSARELRSCSASLAYRSSYHMSLRYRCALLRPEYGSCSCPWRISPGFGGRSTEASGADPESLTSTCYRRYGWKELKDPMGRRNLVQLLEWPTLGCVLFAQAMKDARPSCFPTR